MGTSNADTLNGTDNPDDIYGRAGNDILRGRDRPDNLYGQRGSDTLLGGPGYDPVDPIGNSYDYLIGGPGNDTLRGGADRDHCYFANNRSRDTIADSSAFASWLLFYLGDKEVTDNLTITLFPSDTNPETKNASGTSTITWGSDTLFEYVVGGTGNDTITGDFRANQISGREGSDTISTLSGNDTIYVANDGYSDTVNCGSGLFGTQDNDLVSYDSSDDVSNNCEQKHLVTP